MTYISWEQNHIDNDIGHIYIKKKKCNEQHKYTN